MTELRYYVSASGKNICQQWLIGLKDRRGRARIAMRLNRLSTGNFGDWKTVGEGVNELRIDYGPGYRVYFANVDRQCVLLLCGGDKSRQSADIARAISYWQDYQHRSRS